MAFPTNATLDRPDPAALVAAGLAHHGAGRLAEAEGVYRRVLADHPRHPDALHLLGALLLQAGRPAEAVEWMRQAIRCAPDNASCFSNLASALRRLGRRDAAEAACRRAVALDPGSGDALNNFANVLSDQGRHGDAATALRRQLRLKPQRTEQRLLLAQALILAGRAEEAIEELMVLLGMAPSSAAAYANLGMAHRRLGRAEEAVRYYRCALGFAPGDPGVLNNLGVTLQDLGRLDEAVACFRMSIAMQPDAAHTHLNLGLAARDLMRVDAMIALTRTAVRLDPSLAEAHTGLGFGLLLKGELEEGFAEYEWRSRMADFPSPRRSFSSPAWDGSDLTGRTLLVHDEQGVGDTIMFARFAAQLQARGVRVFMECNTQVVRLLSSMPGIEGVIGRFDTPPQHDAHAALASLPHRLGTMLYTIPADTPYLRAEPELAARWATRIGPPPDRRETLRVGLVWAGNPGFKADHIRSPRLKAFLPLLDVPGVAFFGLQKGAGREDLETCGPLPASFTDLGAEISDFADTAAIMETLDLVISSCTAPAHLAGALGRPVWTVLPFSPDWRWLDQGVCTPWYPTMRLFRQDRRGAWAPVLGRVRAALQALVRSRA
ncbi:tetratricopeptide (TPR) repeat protein [Azospirillum brasilense]|uniref:Tetratricopeptide (TPR) repeat protein n=1 Tax=Azospirillum brasilense TaxID=192 RepID=A0A560AUI4_AZOBR|nr:tetratricopeptide repeat-containing glycosyltransferase family protein [Azospirillum brasilense]TWA64020.1 tetratricopeptide (TPR) repeat protein [Azospirillum brasilense]